MAVAVLNIAQTVQVSGDVTTTELLDIFFPHSTTIRWVVADATEGDEAIVIGPAGQVIAHFVAPEGPYSDEMVLNADVRGCVVSTLDSGTLYFFKHSGRSA